MHSAKDAQVKIITVQTVQRQYYHNGKRQNNSIRGNNIKCCASLAILLHME